MTTASQPERSEKLASAQPPTPGCVLDQIVERDGEYASTVPTSVDSRGVDKEVLLNLVIKWAQTVPNFTTGWATRREQRATLGHESIRPDILVWATKTAPTGWGPARCS